MYASHRCKTVRDNSLFIRLILSFYHMLTYTVKLIY